MENRKILFRAKRLDNKQWIEGDLKHLSDNNRVAIEGEHVVAEVDPTTVCQYTGLKDTKGNMLWEHDLIHFVGFEPTAEIRYG